MAKGIERLSPRAVATSKCPPEKSARFLADGGGLYLRVGSSGSRSWIFRYMSRASRTTWGSGRCTPSVWWKLSLLRVHNAACAMLGRTQREALSVYKLARRAGAV